MPDKAIDEMNRAELMDRFHKICLKGKFDSCKPCPHYSSSGWHCTHPDQPDNIIARRMKGRAR